MDGCTIFVYHYRTITAAAGAANAAVRSDLYNHIRIICSHYWCPDMRFGRRRQPLVRHRGRLSLRCKNDYPPSPPDPPQALYQGTRGVLRRAPCPPTRDAAAQLLDRPNPPSPGALYQGPEGRGGIYIPPHGPSSGPSGEEYFVYKKNVFCLKHVQTILTNFKTMDRRDRAHNRQANGT